MGCTSVDVRATSRTVPGCRTQKLLKFKNIAMYTRGHEEILVGNGEAFFFPLELLFPGGDPLGPPFACGTFVCKYEL
jgi:hypothetical protein